MIIYRDNYNRQNMICQMFYLNHFVWVLDVPGGKIRVAQKVVSKVAP